MSATDDALVDELHALACELAVGAGEQAKASGVPAAAITST